MFRFSGLGAGLLQGITRTQDTTPCMAFGCYRKWAKRFCSIVSMLPCFEVQDRVGASQNGLSMRIIAKMSSYRSALLSGAHLVSVLFNLFVLFFSVVGGA